MGKDALAVVGVVVVALASGDEGVVAGEELVAREEPTFFKVAVVVEVAVVDAPPVLPTLDRDLLLATPATSGVRSRGATSGRSAVRRIPLLCEKRMEWRVRVMWKT